MKNFSLFRFYTVFILLALLIPAGFFSCSKDNPASQATTRIQGILNLPFETPGKTWVVLIDNDLDGGNGYVKLGMGTCGSGSTVSYAVDNVPNGIYYVYAIVFIVGSQNVGPQVGDLIGIYGGQYPDDIPTTPNAEISSSEKQFDIDLSVLQMNI